MRDENRLDLESGQGGFPPGFTPSTADLSARLRAEIAVWRLVRCLRGRRARIDIPTKQGLVEKDGRDCGGACR